MKILFVGDVVGRGGRRVLREKLPELKEEHGIDFTIANVENAAGGFGITSLIAEQILGFGVDVMTSGNHIWDKKESFQCLDHEPRLLRPGNYPPGVPGRSSYVGESYEGINIAVVNVQGRVFMPMIDCPFRFMEQTLPGLREQAYVVIVDLHAEATSEKMALGWFLDGKVTAVLGTHTHVPTADTRILPDGTAYVTDVGMTGSYESVIGMKVEESLNRFLTGLHTRFEPAVQNPRLCGVVIDVDDDTGKARSITRCQRDLD
ncbi:MAG TPA: TIGR00282 family metallophosphoesterase [Acidobacteriota bacterium]|nr:TIGR00282 family metallophosphoesterase [Acidobacteriota bacterium]